MKPSMESRWKALVSSLTKDVKLLVRNWHTILSFMILPFVLIVLIGFLFGADTRGTITVGVDGVDPTILPENDEIRIIEVQGCATDFAWLDLDACIVNDGERIEILVDNSKTNLYAYTVSLLQQAVERTNEQQAISSITKFKQDLATQLELLDEAQLRFADVEGSLAEANRSIEDLQTAFDGTQRSLAEERIALQETRAELESLNVEYEDRSERISEQLMDLEGDLDELEENLTEIRPQVTEEYQESIDSMLEEIDESRVLIDELESTLATVERSQNVVLAQVIEASERLDALLSNFSLYADQIGEQKQLVLALSETAIELDEQLAAVQSGTRSAIGFTPSEILRSLNARFVLYYDEDIRLLILPVVVMLILIFLSTVIGALLMHEEIASPAMVRVELSGVERWIIDVSKIAVITLVVLLNVLLMYVMAMLLWSANFGFRLPLLLAISLPAIIIFAQLGAALAYTIRQPFLLFVSATFSSMVFIVGSGILRPQELLDPARAAVVSLNPGTLFLETTRSAVLGQGIPSLFGLVVWLVLSAALLVAARIAWHRTVFRD